MRCYECPHLEKVNGNYKCNHFVDKEGRQLLTTHTLEVKVLTKSKPHYCEVDENGKEVDDD